jgi:hypothetical protein
MALVIRRRRPAVRREVGRLDRAGDHVDVRVPRRIRVGVARQVRERRGRDGVDRSGKPLERRPERPLPAPIGRIRTFGAPSGDAVVTAPRRPLLDPRDRVGAGGLVGDDLGDRDDVEAAIDGRAVGVHEALEEQVPELGGGVQLAVGRDQGKRRIEGPARHERGTTRSRTKRSASDVASGSNETADDRPPSRRRRRSGDRPELTRHGRRVSIVDAACHGRGS